jgi:hypothetical protein
VSPLFSQALHYSCQGPANDSYAGWIGTVGAAHEGVPHPTLEDAATRLAAIAGTSTCHIAQSKEGILVPGVVSISLSSSLSPVPDSYTSLICHQSPLPICLAPLEDPISLATASSLTTSGDHTETQSSQDYG